MSTIVASLPIRTEKTAPFRWPLLLIGIGLIVVYAADTVAASMATYLPFDVPVERFIQSINWGPLGQVFMALDWTEGTRQQILGIAGIAVIAAVNWRAVPMVVLAALSGAVYTVTAMVINRPRPPDTLVHVIRHTGSSSFPSGHVAFFSWFLIMLVLCIAGGRLPKAIVGALWVVVALILLTVCIGRIYLGEHWPSDVSGGPALGLGCTATPITSRQLSNPVLARKK